MHSRPRTPSSHRSIAARRLPHSASTCRASGCSCGRTGTAPTGSLRPHLCAAGERIRCAVVCKSPFSNNAQENFHGLSGAFRVEWPRLSHNDDQGFLPMLFAGVLDLPWWGLVLVALGLTHITIAAVTIYLHRCQAHRALELHPVVSHFFRFWLWMTTGMVTKE